MRAFRVPGFARLATTYTLNELADWMATVTLAVLVFDATQSALATTALFIATKFLPGLLVPVLAARLDGRPVSRVLGRAYALEALAFVALALTASDVLLPLVLVLAALDGTIAATARAVTRAATVAVLAPQERLREGNAVLNGGFAVMYAGAPALAGLLVAALGAAPVLGIAAGVFAALGLVAGTARDLPAGSAEAARARPGHLRAAFAYVRRRRELVTLLAGQGMVVLLFTMVTPIEVVYVKESLGAGDAGLGLLLTAAGIGVLVGSAVFARSRGASLSFLVGVPTLAMALGYIGLAVAPNLAVACAVAAAVGVGNGIQWVAVVTALQEATDEHFQARVSGLLEAVATGAPGVGFALGGTITAIFDPRIAFAAAGAGVLLVLLAGTAVIAGARGAGGLAADVAEPEPARS